MLVWTRSLIFSRRIPGVDWKNTDAGARAGQLCIIKSDHLAADRFAVRDFFLFVFFVLFFFFFRSSSVFVLFISLPSLSRLHSFLPRSTLVTLLFLFFFFFSAVFCFARLRAVCLSFSFAFSVVPFHHQLPGAFDHFFVPFLRLSLPPPGDTFHSFFSSIRFASSQPAVFTSPKFCLKGKQGAVSSHASVL